MSSTEEYFERYGYNVRVNFKLPHRPESGWHTRRFPSDEAAWEWVNKLKAEGKLDEYLVEDAEYKAKVREQAIKEQEEKIKMYQEKYGEHWKFHLYHGGTTRSMGRESRDDARLLGYRY